MSAVYEFLRADGRRIERRFPFGQCPSEIVDDDGVRARKVFSVVGMKWREGHETSSSVSAQSERRRRENIAAGDRGRAEWRERTPKVHY